MVPVGERHAPATANAVGSGQNKTGIFQMPVLWKSYQAIKRVGVTDDRAVILQRQIMPRPGGNGHHTFQPGRHVALTTAVIPPGHHCAIALER